jgi:hypothetical protein
LNSLTLIIVHVTDPDSFERLSLEERRKQSLEWKTFEIRSGRFLDTFLMKATGTDLGEFSYEETRDGDGVTLTTCFIDEKTLPRDLETLERFLGDETATQLCTLAGRADRSRVQRALRTGDWPDGGNPAEESAAFAFHLVELAKTAIRHKMGLCLEHRGHLRY